MVSSPVTTRHAGHDRPQLLHQESSSRVGAQTRWQVLRVTEQTHDIEMIAVFEVAPTNRESLHRPTAQTGNVSQFAESERPAAGQAFDPLHGGKCRIEESAS